MVKREDAKKLKISNKNYWLQMRFSYLKFWYWKWKFLFNSHFINRFITIYFPDDDECCADISEIVIHTWHSFHMQMSKFT